MMLIVASFNAVAQSKTLFTLSNPTPWDPVKKYDWNRSLKKGILPFATTFVGGGCGAMREVLLFRRSQFFDRFPNANRSFWDTEISSERSKKILGGPMDAYHLFQYPHTWLCYGGGAIAGINVAIPFVRKERRKWWHVAADIGIQTGASMLGYIAGSTLVYNGIFHK